MKLTGLLATTAVAANQAMAADFTNSFDSITSGSTITLSWDGVQEEHYPLCITAQVIDKGGDGFSANAYRVNITRELSTKEESALTARTVDASGTSHTWTGAPYPLRSIPGGLYQLELRSMTGGHVPLLAKSPFFSISDPGSGSGAAGSASPQPVPADSEGGGSGISKPVAIGIGVAVGVPSAVGTAVVAWCFRKRQRRAAMEKRRLKRSEFVIS